MGVETDSLDCAASGGLEVRLAQSAAEIAAAQALRYRVFYDEMGAKPTDAMAAERRDFDEFDQVADHLLVLDQGRVAGCYRLMRREHVEKIGRYYSASEYDLTTIRNFSGNAMELGRSCVDAEYRTSMTMQMLWRGIAGYVFKHNIDLMFGCASLPGTDPQALAPQLSYLWHHHLAPAELRPRALPALYTRMDLLPAEELNARRLLAALPPLIKGYLRLGGFIGDGAVIDHQFNTTDVCVLVKTDLINDKYRKNYDRTAERAL